MSYFPSLIRSHQKAKPSKAGVAQGQQCSLSFGMAVRHPPRWTRLDFQARSGVKARRNLLGQARPCLPQNTDKALKVSRLINHMRKRDVVFAYLDHRL